MDGSSVALWQGAVPVTVTVDSVKSFRFGKVTYQHHGDMKAVEICLEFPREHEDFFENATILDDRSFTFNVRTAGAISAFGILQNSYSWRPFAVFRIECDTGKPVFVSAAVPDPRTTKSLTIRVP
jgi:hypothetical protein